MSGVEFIKIKTEDDGIRLNRWFLKYYPGLTLGRLQKLLRTKQIKVDGAKVEANTRLTAGQEIRIPPLDNEKREIKYQSVSANDVKYITDMVIYKDENIWATQKAMATLFDCSTDNIGLHLKNIFASGELIKESVTEKISATATSGGGRRSRLTLHHET